MRGGGVLATAARLGMAFVPFYPLASGLLSGAYRRGQPTPRGSRLGGDGRPAEDVISRRELDAVERLAAYAEAHGHTLLELSLSYLAAHAPVASVIAGATKPEQVRADAAATGAWALTAAELDEIGGLLAGSRRAGVRQAAPRHMTVDGATRRRGTAGKAQREVRSPCHAPPSTC